ncbi:MAG: prohead protease, partial [Ectothiorhodospiraceae bacterium]|nr:prohead protease [Ectothiorhodospiraceae bacterium]
MSDTNYNRRASDRQVGELSSVLDFLRRHAPFADMDAEHLDFLARRLKPAFYSRNDKITDPDDGPARCLYIIRQGRVRGEAPAQGDRLAGDVWELVAGECFPVGALLSRPPGPPRGPGAPDT